MSESNKTYRIKANIGREYSEEYISLETNLLQDFDTLDILSIKIKSADTYRLHNSNYGVVVGRVLANNGFGIPNAKLSIFIKSDILDNPIIKDLYPYSTSYAENNNGIRYNLLPDKQVDDCHQVVGTFPNKRYMLDNDVVLEVFDKYYKYTTRTNNAGDFLIMGIPVGQHTLHMDLDLSDCGILSQRPRDFVHKGYTIEQFENSSLFKKSTNYNELSQIFTQDKIINVIPFWGNESLGESIGITRADIDVAFKFEPTCVFIGSVVSDNSSNGITKKCRATENMGNMEEMVTGLGTIEMIRKTPTGAIESFAVRGNQLINGDGIWCYQIPMNLDYVMTDEYGNMVPTNDPEKGIPTRTSVRFRISMQDNEENLDFFYRSKVLVPHNPHVTDDGRNEDYDYEFGSYTRDESFRDLFWDNVYTVKSYIPRFQKKKTTGWKDRYFTGVKNCNFYGNNNPFPYNNIRIKLPFMFSVMCVLIKCLIAIVSIFNSVLYRVGRATAIMGNIKIGSWRPFKRMYEISEGVSLNVLSEGLCPDLENWFFAPIYVKEIETHKNYDVLEQTMAKLNEGGGFYDEKSIDYTNKEVKDDVICITTKKDYLISCVEMNLAMEYRVINFDFYNDWVNGVIYIPRFMRYIKRKKRAGKNGKLGKIKIKGCMDDTSVCSKTLRYAQQCSIGYNENQIEGYTIYTNTSYPLEKTNSTAIRRANNLHKNQGFQHFAIFGKLGGICHEHTTSKKQNVYYMKPCEWHDNKKVLLYATDIVLLGSLRTCNENGLPQAFKYLSSTSYVMPPNLALTNMETNGPLYTNENGTICAGTSNQNLKYNTDNDKGVSILNPDEGVLAELKAYSQSNEDNFDSHYDENEIVDIIPLTEMAGIAWNYTGPGQGGEDKKKMYHPGGHFLGITCMNSMTNLKSCINLSRVCEVGTTLSQRKEDIIDIHDDGTMDYIYTVPNGFISGNEINGEDFRTMFATMNQKPLRATKRNNENGYFYYDFDFVKPLNFNGAFESVVSRAQDKYNGKIDIKIDDDAELKKFGITKGLGYDFDSREHLLSQTRTIETPSIDYYRFRFGLSYDDISTNKKTSKKHASRFLGGEKGEVFLPQYENSYYFYFGLKAGATALDEFNKQFFSKCDTTVVGKKNPSIEVSIDKIDLLKQTGDITIVIENVDMPLMNIMYKKQIEDNKWEIHDITSEWNQYYVITLTGISFGNYIIEVLDFEGVKISSSFTIGMDIFKYTATTYNFNTSNALAYGELSEEDRTKYELFIGGYIQIENVDISESYKTEIISGLTFIVTNEKLGNNVTESASTVFYVEENQDTFSYKRINVKSAYTNYNLYLLYNALDEKGNVKQLELSKALFLESFQIKDGSKLNLAMGWENLPFYTLITSSGASKTITPIESAWTSDGVNYLEYKTEDDVISLNFGCVENENKWWEIFDGEKIAVNDDKSGTIVGNWLKRLNINKSSNNTNIFSNNVFAINGEKILWGVPQNEDRKYSSKIGKVLFNSIESATNYEGFSLDDDASYYATNDNHYSAIAINDEKLVSGDFFAMLSGGTIYFNNDIAKGLKPSVNTGYVFKSLPDNELYFYTYKGGDNSYEYPSGSTNGLYYSSFEYPVIEKPFNASTNFYIWNNIDVYMPENVDNIAEVRYNELAGRTELQLTNGIKYNGNYGLSTKAGRTVSGVNISNITLDTFNKVMFESGHLNTVRMWGMDVETKEYNEDGTTTTEIIPAYKKVSGMTIATGVDNIESVVCEITEGYPEGASVYNNLVSKINTKTNFYEHFPHYVKYEYFKGRGFDINTYDKNGRMTKGGGMMCYINSGDTKKLFYDSVENNDDYVFINTGTKNVPCYRILCQYINPENHTSPIGGLCFLTITYLTPNKYQATFEYKELNSGHSKTWDILKYDMAGLRFNIKNIIEKSLDGIDKYIRPLKNKRLKCDDTQWNGIINNDNINYIAWIDKNSATTEENVCTDNFYYVETYDNITKIYPILLKDNVINDGIILSTYYIVEDNDGGSGHVLTLNYKIYKQNNNTVLDDLEATTSGSAIEKLQYVYNNKVGSLIDLRNEEMKNDLFSLSFSAVGVNIVNSAVDNNEDGVYFDVYFSLKINISGAVSDYDKENNIKESVYFYISERKNGVRLDIERLSKGDYKPLVINNLEERNAIDSVSVKYNEESSIPLNIKVITKPLNDKGIMNDEIQILNLDENNNVYIQTLLYNSFNETFSYTKQNDENNALTLTEIQNFKKRIVVDNHVRNYNFRDISLDYDPFEEFTCLLELTHIQNRYIANRKNNLSPFKIAFEEGKLQKNLILGAGLGDVEIESGSTLPGGTGGTITPPGSGTTGGGNHEGILPNLSGNTTYLGPKDVRYVILHNNGVSFAISGKSESATTLEIPWITTQNEYDFILTTTNGKHSLNGKWEINKNGEWNVSSKLVQKNSNNTKFALKLTVDDSQYINVCEWVLNDFKGFKPPYNHGENYRKDEDNAILNIHYGSFGNPVLSIEVKRVPNLIFNFDKSVYGFFPLIYEEVEYVELINTAISLKYQSFNGEERTIYTEGNCSIPFAFSGESITLNFDVILEYDSDGTFENNYNPVGLYYLTDGTEKIVIIDGNEKYPVSVKNNYNDREHIIVIDNNGDEKELNSKEVKVVLERFDESMTLPFYVKMYDAQDEALNFEIIYWNEIIYTGFASENKCEVYIEQRDAEDNIHLNEILEFKWGKSNGGYDIYVVKTEKEEYFDKDDDSTYVFKMDSDYYTRAVFIHTLFRPDNKTVTLYFVKNNLLINE